MSVALGHPNAKLGHLVDAPPMSRFLLSLDQTAKH
jgi:hypothetical protein